MTSHGGSDSFATGEGGPAPLNVVASPNASDHGTTSTNSQTSGQQRQSQSQTSRVPPMIARGPGSATSASTNLSGSGHTTTTSASGSLAPLAPVVDETAMNAPISSSASAPAGVGSSAGTMTPRNQSPASIRGVAVGSASMDGHEGGVLPTPFRTPQRDHNASPSVGVTPGQPGAQTPTNLLHTPGSRFGTPRSSAAAAQLQQQLQQQLIKQEQAEQAIQLLKETIRKMNEERAESTRKNELALAQSAALLKEAEHRLQATQAHNEELKQQLQRTRAERNAVTGDLAADHQKMEATITELKTQLAKLEEERAEERRQFTESWHNREAEYQASMAGIRRDLELWAEERVRQVRDEVATGSNEQFQQHLKQVQDDFAAQNAVLEAKVKELTSSLAQAAQENENLRNQLQSAESTFSEKLARVEQESQQRFAEALEKEKEHLKAEMIALQEQSEARATEMATQVAQLWSERLQTVTAELEESKRASDAAQVELQQYREASDLWNERLQALSSELEAVQHEKQALQTEVQGYRDTALQWNERIQSLMTELAAAKQAGEAAQAELNAYRETAGTWSERFQSLTSELEESKRNCESLQMELQSYKDAAALWEEQVKAMSAELEEVKRTSASAQAELETYRSNIGNQAEQQQQQLESVMAQYQELLKQFNEVSASLESTRELAEKYKSSLDEATTARENLAQQLTTRDETIAALTQERDSLRNDLEYANADLELMRMARTNEEDELQAVKDQLAEAQNRIAQELQNVQTLQDQLQASAAQHQEEIQKRDMAWQSHIESLTQQTQERIDVLTQQVDAHKQRESELLQELESFKQGTSQSSEEADALRTQLQESLDKATQLEAKLQSESLIASESAQMVVKLSEDIAQLQAREAELQQRLDDALLAKEQATDARESALQQQLQDSERTVSDMQQKIDELRAQLDEVQTLANERGMHVASLEAERAHMQAQLHKMQEEAQANLMPPLPVPPAVDQVQLTQALAQIAALEEEKRVLVAERNLLEERLTDAEMRLAEFMMMSMDETQITSSQPATSQQPQQEQAQEPLDEQQKQPQDLPQAEPREALQQEQPQATQAEFVLPDQSAQVSATQLEWAEWAQPFVADDGAFAVPDSSLAQSAPVASYDVGQSGHAEPVSQSVGTEGEAAPQTVHDPLQAHNTVYPGYTPEIATLIAQLQAEVARYREEAAMWEETAERVKKSAKERMEALKQKAARVDELEQKAVRADELEQQYQAADRSLKESEQFIERLLNNKLELEQQIRNLAQEIEELREKKATSQGESGEVNAQAGPKTPKKSQEPLPVIQDLIDNPDDSEIDFGEFGFGTLGEPRSDIDDDEPGTHIQIQRRSIEDDARSQGGSQFGSPSNRDTSVAHVFGLDRDRAEQSQQEQQDAPASAVDVSAYEAKIAELTTQLATFGETVRQREEILVASYSQALESANQTIIALQAQVEALQAQALQTQQIPASATAPTSELDSAVLVVQDQESIAPGSAPVQESQAADGLAVVQETVIHNAEDPLDDDDVLLKAFGDDDDFFKATDLSNTEATQATRVSASSIETAPQIDSTPQLEVQVATNETRPVTNTEPAPSERITELESQLSAAHDKIAQLTMQITTLEGSLAMRDEELQTVREKLIGDANSSADRIRELEETLAVSSAKSSELELTCQSLKDELHAANEKFVTLRQELEEVAAEALTAKTDATAAAAELADIKSKLAQLESERDAARTDLTKKQEELEAAQAEATLFDENRQIAENAYREVQATLEAAQDRISHLEESLAHLTAELGQERTKITAQEEQSRQREAHILELSAQVQLLQSAKEGLELELSNKQADLDKLQTSLEDKTQLQIELEKAQTELLRTRDELDQAQSKLVASDDEIAGLKRSVSEYAAAAAAAAAAMTANAATIRFTEEEVQAKVQDAVAKAIAEKDREIEQLMAELMERDAAQIAEIDGPVTTLRAEPNVSKSGASAENAESVQPLPSEDPLDDELALAAFGGLDDMFTSSGEAANSKIPTENPVAPQPAIDQPQMAQTVDASSAEITTLQAMLDQVREELARTQAELAAALSQNEELNETKEKLSESNRRADELTQQIEQAFSTMTKMKEAIKEKNARIQELEEVHKRAVEAAQEAQLAEVRAQDELDALKLRYEQLEAGVSQYQQLQSQLEIKTAEYEELRQQYESKLAEMNNMQQILNEKESEYELVQAQLEEKLLELGQLNAQLKLEKERADEAESAQRSRDEATLARQAQLVEEHASLTERVQMLEAQLEAAIEEANHAKTALGDAERRAEEARQALETAQAAALVGGTAALKDDSIQMMDQTIDTETLHQRMGSVWPKLDDEISLPTSPHFGESAWAKAAARATKLERLRNLASRGVDDNGAEDTTRPVKLTLTFTNDDEEPADQEGAEATKLAHPHTDAQGKKSRSKTSVEMSPIAYAGRETPVYEDAPDATENRQTEDKPTQDAEGGWDVDWDLNEVELVDQDGKDPTTQLATPTAAAESATTHKVDENLIEERDAALRKVAMLEQQQTELQERLNTAQREFEELKIFFETQRQAQIEDVQRYQAEMQAYIEALHGELATLRQNATVVAEPSQVVADGSNGAPAISDQNVGTDTATERVLTENEANATQGIGSQEPEAQSEAQPAAVDAVAETATTATENLVQPSESLETPVVATPSAGTGAENAAAQAVDGMPASDGAATAEQVNYLTTLVYQWAELYKQEQEKVVTLTTELEALRVHYATLQASAQEAIQAVQAPTQETQCVSQSAAEEEPTQHAKSSTDAGALEPSALQVQDSALLARARGLDALVRVLAAEVEACRAGIAEREKSLADLVTRVEKLGVIEKEYHANLAAKREAEEAERKRKKKEREEKEAAQAAERAKTQASFIDRILGRKPVPVADLTNNGMRYNPVTKRYEFDNAGEDDEESSAPPPPPPTNLSKIPPLPVPVPSREEVAAIVGMSLDEISKLIAGDIVDASALPLNSGDYTSILAGGSGSGQTSSNSSKPVPVALSSSSSAPLPPAQPAIFDINSSRDISKRYANPFDSDDEMGESNSNTNELTMLMPMPMPVPMPVPMAVDESAAEPSAPAAGDSTESDDKTETDGVETTADDPSINPFGAVVRRGQPQPQQQQHAAAAAKEDDFSISAAFSAFGDTSEADRIRREKLEEERRKRKLARERSLNDSSRPIIYQGEDEQPANQATSVSASEGQALDVTTTDMNVSHVGAQPATSEPAPMGVNESNEDVTQLRARLAESEAAYANAATQYQTLLEMYTYVVNEFNTLKTQMDAMLAQQQPQQSVSQEQSESPEHVSAENGKLAEPNEPRTDQASSEASAVVVPSQATSISPSETVVPEAVQEELTERKSHSEATPTSAIATDTNTSDLQAEVQRLQAELEKARTDAITYATQMQQYVEKQQEALTLAQQAYAEVAAFKQQIESADAADEAVSAAEERGAQPPKSVKRRFRTLTQRLFNLKAQHKAMRDFLVGIITLISQYGQVQQPTPASEEGANQDEQAQQQTEACYLTPIPASYVQGLVQLQQTADAFTELMEKEEAAHTGSGLELASLGDEEESVSKPDDLSTVAEGETAEDGGEDSTLISRRRHVLPKRLAVRSPAESEEPGSTTSASTPELSNALPVLALAQQELEEKDVALSELRQALEDLTERYAEAESRLRMLSAAGITPQSLTKGSFVPGGKDGDIKVFFSCSKFFIASLILVFIAVIGATTMLMNES